MLRSLLAAKKAKAQAHPVPSPGRRPWRYDELGFVLRGPSDACAIRREAISATRIQASRRIDAHICECTSDAGGYTGAADSERREQMYFYIGVAAAQLCV